MTYKLILRLIEVSFELKVIITSNPEISEKVLGFFDDKYTLEIELFDSGHFVLKVHSVIPPSHNNSILFKYSSRLESFTLSEIDFSNERLNSVVNFIVDVHKEFKYNKTEKRTLTF
jgi:hypothetical protein|tara:strand:+ start:479 stop:826 length:348 start_codon:yes stop_codon:yes gene_type:complete